MAGEKEEKLPRCLVVMPTENGFIISTMTQYISIAPRDKPMVAETKEKLFEIIKEYYGDGQSS